MPTYEKKQIPHHTDSPCYRVAGLHEPWSESGPDGRADERRHGSDGRLEAWRGMRPDRPEANSGDVFQESIRRAERQPCKRLECLC